MATERGIEVPDDANEVLFDALVRHQIYLMRLSGSLRQEIQSILDATEQDISDKIRSRLSDASGLKSVRELRRLEALLSIVRNIRRKAWEEVDKVWRERLTDLAKSEPEFMAAIVLTASPVLVETILPPAQTLKALVTKSPFEGRPLVEWARTIADDDIRRIESAIRVGLISGENGATIARRVVGSAALKGADGVTEITRRGATSISRTAVNFISNSARDEFLALNADLFDEEQFVATLDSRTTAICRANGGKKFPLGTGPRPPLHWGCRSLRVPVLLDEALGDRPAKPSTERMLVQEFAAQNGLKAVSKRSRLPHGTKGAYDKFSRKRIRELTGQVPAATSYQEWLKRQSKEFQEDVLGKTKARLFRDGKLPLDKFVNRQGDELTLAELAGKHADAFKAAGLDPSAFQQ